MVLNKRCKFLTDFLFREPTADIWKKLSMKKITANSESWQNAGHFKRKRLRVLFVGFKVFWTLKIFHTRI
jgi:hypothetical protein